MKKLQLVIELEYDDKLMHGDDEEAKDWFIKDVLYNDGTLILHSNEIGDQVGFVKVIARGKI